MWAVIVMASLQICYLPAENALQLKHESAGKKKVHRGTPGKAARIFRKKYS
jgi:hypothetical protein